MVKNDIVLDLNKVDRETALRTWLQYNRIEVKDLAGQLGVHPGTITRIINGQRASRTLIKRLISLGIPEQLLPEPGPGPGRPPGT
jgi:transcriptional regulator with XRE-family HTH domain